MEFQFIGADLGRGFVKGYTEVMGIPTACLYKSVVGDAREIDFSKYEDPIYLTVDEEEFFVGEVAEKESFNPIPNFSDDKTTDVAKKLMYALLNSLAVKEKVKICLGVPNKTFNKSTLEAVRDTFLGQTIEIYDNLTKKKRTVTISDITIFRESDAALFYTINNHKDKVALKSKRLGMVTVGFRTTEITYFDKGMKFNDKLSRTLEIGNRTILDIIQKNLEKKNIIKTIHEIDADDEYNTLKAAVYKNLVQRINQEIEMNWINFDEMNLFIAGGTSKKFEDIPSKFEKVRDPQLITAKGLNFIAESRLK